MSTVIDASALIAFLRDETGAEAVQKILSLPQTCYVHALNLCEVYYDFLRASTQTAAESAIGDLIGLGIEERNDMDSQFWREVFRHMPNRIHSLILGIRPKHVGAAGR